MSPEVIRALRGALSRAAFAERLGVTPHTIYRWELPADARDARRPRGVELARLEALRTGGAPLPRSAPAAPSAPAPASGAASGDETAAVLGAIETLMRGDWKDGHTQLVQIVTRARPASLDVRALAASGLAIVESLLRADPRGAMAALAPALADAEQGRLGAHAAAAVYAIAAYAHALPDAALFDPGRVHAHAARAQGLSRGDLPEVDFLAWLAAAHGAVLVGEDQLVERVLAQRDPASWGDLPPLLAVHQLELRALGAACSGQRALSTKLLEEMIETCAAHRYHVVEARALALLAVRRLDDFADPAQVLAGARRAQHIARASRAAASTHTLLALRAEIEALMRVGQTAAALALIDEVEAYTRDTGMPPLHAAPAVMHALYLAGRPEPMQELVRALRACPLPALRPACRAYAGMVEAMRLLATCDDVEATIAAFERAAVDARGWSSLERDVLVFGCAARLPLAGDDAMPAALRRAHRALDASPSPWAAAHLRRVHGTLVAAQGRWTEARPVLDAAAGTFEAGGDVTAAMLVRHIMATFADLYGEPDAAARLAESSARVQALGLRVPAPLRAGAERLRQRRRAYVAAPARTAELQQLVALLQRLAVQGADPALVRRELVAVATELLPARAIRLDEIDANGVAHQVGGADVADGSFTWIEIGGGLRLGALGPVGEHERALLTIAATTAGLALDVAALRGTGATRSEPARGDELADIPGLVAVSPAMRALRTEIGHVAGSRSTVVIQGESGTGKELVARAIHDLSARAGRPYIAFNCAAVPRELFEGQLFGHRKGAFTGAVRDAAGVLRAADGGTLFLDEIGELPLDIQPKLLRVLENGEIFPLGDKRPQHVDVRVVAATHRDLAKQVHDGLFREDLYYRLQVIVLRVPPLRDRREDVAPIARHFLRTLAAGEAPPLLAPDALARLAAHDWPGNVRELRNVIERALARRPVPRVLGSEHLRVAVDRVPAARS